MRRIIRGGVLGLLGGLLYAFISFYLITPTLRNNLGALSFYGFQGCILGIAFNVLKSVSNKVLVIGAISGFISCVFAVGITLYNVINSFSVVPYEVRVNLVLFTTGGTLAGLVIGLISKRFEPKKVTGT